MSARPIRPTAEEIEALKAHPPFMTAGLAAPGDLGAEKETI